MLLGIQSLNPSIKVCLWALMISPNVSVTICQLAIRQLQWEKIGKVENQAKLAIPSHSEPLQWEKLEKLQIGQNLPI